MALTIHRLLEAFGCSNRQDFKTKTLFFFQFVVTHLSFQVRPSRVITITEEQLEPDVSQVSQLEGLNCESSSGLSSRCFVSLRMEAGLPANSLTISQMKMSSSSDPTAGAESGSSGFKTFNLNLGGIKCFSLVFKKSKKCSLRTTCSSGDLRRKLLLKRTSEQHMEPFWELFLTGQTSEDHTLETKTITTKC